MKPIILTTFVLGISFVPAFGASIGVTQKGTNNLPSSWNFNTGGHNPLTFTANNQCQIYCSDTAGGMTCGTLQLTAEVYSDYNSWWNDKLVNCTTSDKGISWVLQDEVSASGGTKTYAFVDLTQKQKQELEQKAKKLPTTSKKLLQKI